MKKHIFTLFSIFGLCACATMQQQKIDWSNQNFDNFIVKYGTPTSKHTLQSGDIAYSFIKPCSFTQAQEEVVVVVNPENKINSVSRVSSCPSLSQEKQHNDYVDPQTNFLREQAAKEEKEKQELRKKIQDRIYELQHELFELEHSSEYWRTSRSLEERVKYYEDFYKDYPNILELDKMLGNETNTYKKAKEEFDKDQPAFKELENRRNHLKEQIANLELQMPPEQKDGWEILFEKLF